MSWLDSPHRPDLALALEVQERLPVLHDLFGMAQPVSGGGVDPVDPGFHRVADGGDGLGVVLVAPGVGPAAPAESPGAEADLGQ
jgi:hypothetical protein